MGKIELDHTGSGSGVTLSSDGTDLLLDGTAIGGGGGGGGSAFDTPEVKTANWSVSNSDKGKVFIIDTNGLTLTLPQYSTLDSDWFIRVYTKGNSFQPSYGSPGSLTVDPQYSTYSGRVNGNTNWTMRARQGGILFKDPEQSNNFVFDTHSTNWDFDVNSTANANRANATGWGSVAISGQATASGTGAISIGYLSNATGNDSVAIGGNSAQAVATDAIALGNSRAGGSGSIAIGIDHNTSSAGATGANSIAIGKLTKATGEGAIAIGRDTIASGDDAFAAGERNEATDHNSVAMGFTSVASANFAIAMGYQAAASGNNSVAIGTSITASAIQATSIGGENNTASGTRATALGGSTNYATGQESYAFGNRASAKEIGKYSYGGYFGFSGTFAGGFGVGGSQGGMMILGAATTDATPTVLRTNTSAAGSTNQLVAFTDTCIMFSGTVVAMQNGAQDQGGWEIKGLLKNDGGTTTLVSSNIQTFADGNGWTVGLTADNTNNALAITCTGEAAHNIRWVANISTSEVTYA